MWGLDQDYLGNPFEPLPQVMAIAEFVTKLHAICDGVLYFCVALMVDDNVKHSIAEIAQRLFRNNVKPGVTVITDRYYTCKGLLQFCMM